MGTWERWNTHFSTSVQLELFGVPLRLQQNPNSHNLGTTVWDSSIVFAKYLEQNARKGPLARQSVAGKRAVDLGSGMGLAGLALALLGCNVTLTDIASVLPLLQTNADANLGPAFRAGDSPLAHQAGSVTVAELDWLKTDQLSLWKPDFDFIIGTDCIYNEGLVQNLLQVVLHLATPRTTVVLCNEMRSESVHSEFLQSFEVHFTIKRLPHKKMDATHQHPAIDIFLCKLRKAKPAGTQR